MTHPTLVLLLSALAACAPLYGGKPEKLTNPPKKPVPADALAKAIQWQEDCRAEFFAKTTAPIRKPDAVPLAEAGDNLMRSVTKEKDPRTRARLVVDAMGRYKAALAKDPYNAQATYGLAVAFTRAKQKGCALALLKRLAAIEANGTLSSDASNVISAAVEDRTFAPFRKDADAQLGR